MKVPENYDRGLVTLESEGIKEMSDEHLLYLRHVTEAEARRRSLPISALEITHRQLLVAVKKACFSVEEEDGGIYMPQGYDDEDPITGNILELMDALGIEVENV